MIDLKFVAGRECACAWDLCLVFFQNNLSFCIPDFSSLGHLPSSIDGMVVIVQIVTEKWA